ncbi:MAG: AAA family ATPase [Clostridia bacterium]|nr:AAA family ATPase [Clostridia bacterium]
MKNAFEKIIGYEEIKEELMQICDMIKNRERYEALGAKLPHGILLHGDPGLGKSLMAECFIEESGLKSFTVRYDADSKVFINRIKKTFNEAVDVAPTIILFDDMDKFENEDEDRPDAEAYVAIQSGMDAVKKCGVIVIATVNNIRKLPRSLIRPGRFDRKIEIERPTAQDAVKIIKYYLRDKKLSDNVNLDDLSKMISYSSCAELETVMNEAAISAAYAKRDSIDMADLTKAVLRMQYGSPENHDKKSADDIKKTALHEAGHLVASEVLCSESVGLASLRSKGRDSTSGFIHRCKDLPRRPYHIIVSLAGKAAVELYYGESVASGCWRDLSQAYHYTQNGIYDNGTSGLSLVWADGEFGASEDLISRIEQATSTELERYMLKAKDILLKNRDFLEKIAAELEAKETLLFSDIQKIKSTTTVTPVAV